MPSLSKLSLQATILIILFFSCCLQLIPCVLSARQVFLCRKEETAFPCLLFPDMYCGIGFSNTEILKTTGQSHCQVCKTNNTRFTVPETCESYPEDANFCDPQIAIDGLPCLQEYNPVCGVDYRGEQMIYYNYCTACTSENVVYYVDGECQRKNLRA